MGCNHIALIGAYWQGNFGDDLMAVIYARALQGAGHRVKVFRLDESYAREFEIETCQRIDELLAGARVCVWGGGGILVANSYPPNEASSDISGVIYEMTQVCIKRGIPVVLSSIGGDGFGRWANIPAAASALLSSGAVSAVSVRLQSEVELVQSYCRECRYFPDVVLSSLHYAYPGKKNSSEVEKCRKLRVGLNLSNQKENQSLVDLLFVLSKLTRRFEIEILLTHLDSVPYDYEKLSSIFARRIPVTRPERMKEYLTGLSRFDMIVSSKLHLGLAALALGVEFISFRGSWKVRNALKDYGLQDRYFTSRKALVKRVWGLASMKSFPSTETTASEGHIEFLLDYLSTILPASKAI